MGKIDSCVPMIRLVLLVSFFLNFGQSKAQEIEYLNKYLFKVYDTVKYEYQFVRITKDNPTTKIALTFNRDSVKISQHTLLKDEFGTEKSELILRFNDEGLLQCQIKKNLLSGDELLKEFHENGKLKSEVFRIGDDIQNESFFSDDGETISKPVIIEGLPKDGMPGWNRYLSLTLKYPIKAQMNNIEGTVYVAFDLDEVGQISNPEVANPEEVDSLLAQEALRALKKYSDTWTPLRIDGVANCSKMRLPVRFVLTD